MAMLLLRKCHFTAMASLLTFVAVRMSKTLKILVRSSSCEWRVRIGVVKRQIHKCSGFMGWRLRRKVSWTSILSGWSRQNCAITASLVRSSIFIQLQISSVLACRCLCHVERFCVILWRSILINYVKNMVLRRCGHRILQKKICMKRAVTGRNLAMSCSW